MIDANSGPTVSTRMKDMQACAIIHADYYSSRDCYHVAHACMVSWGGGSA